jgi:surfactin synthase thioesterase subunit
MQTMYLYAFPYAAGSQFSYTPFVKASPTWLQWKAFDYAGRGKRMFEQPTTNIHDIVAEFVSYFTQNLKTPYAFYGHSMGSLIAYLLTVEFEKIGLPAPKHLFLSGRGGACIPERYRNAANMTREQIIAEILEMDGKIEALLQNEKMMNVYEKVLRADVMALERYDYQLGTTKKLAIDATVFIGDNDIYTPAQAQRWQQEFSNPIELYTLTGGHFFLYDHLATIMTVIQNTLKE